MDQDLNYHNYFTEIESFFQSKRQNFTVRLSCLDWVLIENWKEQGVPLDAVLKGIEKAFSHKKEINKLAYCVKAVDDVCREQRAVNVEAPHLPEFNSGEVARYLHDLADRVERFDNAIAEMHQIYGLDQNDTDNLYQLGDALMRRQEYEQAVRIYGRLAKMPNVEIARVEALQSAAKRMYDQQQLQVKSS